MIEFNDGHGNWVMRLDEGKIFFNRDEWPNLEPDEFAKAVILILEKATVKMESWENVDFRAEK